MLKFIRNLIPALFILILSCGKPLPQLDQMDLDAWRTDTDGCLGHRMMMTEAITAQKEKLLALDEKEIIYLLGKPDKNELYTRNQKFYSYYLYPAPSCNSGDSTTLTLIIRFNAMGLAKEITIE
ncbi:MAG: hypothetical protein MUE95_07355 [Cyclobacteriaceae bacterium]|jgi:hypothetical protein|nr:hypothetical protein [Cyclobacteriaceae bacterium]